jgi:hypothetical protein
LAIDGPDTKCTSPCPGDPGQSCGSAAYVNVYKTPIAVTHTMNAAPKIAASGNAITLTPVTEPYGIGFDMRINYDDKAGKTEYAENGTGILGHVFAMASQYRILSFVTDVGNLLPVSII